jgi:hypothetical protein
MDFGKLRVEIAVKSKHKWPAAFSITLVGTDALLTQAADFD